jgi:hypothetical protein
MWRLFQRQRMVGETFKCIEEGEMVIKRMRGVKNSGMLQPKGEMIDRVCEAGGSPDIWAVKVSRKG